MRVNANCLEVLIMSSFYLNQEKIEEVRESADIVDIISEYIPIKKTGKNYTGLCPFHSEKKPSFTVSPIKQLYHCFGCGASGNVITFVMNYESVSFIEAIEILAKKYGITLKKKSAYSEDKKKQEIINANEFAFKHFKNNLFSESGKHALEYLKKREINLDTIEKFGLGYAPEGWDNLLRAAQKEGISNKILISAGLIVENEKGKLYDRFRKRIIFTFYNSIGKKIGFAGRNLGDEMPKYLNISESPLYKKRYTLYGLYQSKEEIRKLDKCLIVEGYMDVLALYQAGFKNTVAISGTSLTDEQAKFIRKYTRNIYISFDADKPGKEATLRGISIFIQNGLIPYIMTLVKGKDPDEIVKKEGKEIFQKIVDAAEHFIDFKMRFLLSKYNLYNAVEKAQVVREIGKTLMQVRDLTERQMWLSNVSRKLSVDESILIINTKKSSREQFIPYVSSLNEICHDLVAMLSLKPERYEEVAKVFKEEELLDETSQRILSYIGGKVLNIDEICIADIVNLIEDRDERKRVSSTVFNIKDDIKEEDFAKMIDQYIIHIKADRLKERWKSIRQEIKSRGGDIEGVRTLLEEQRRIASILKNLGGNVVSEKSV